MPSFLQNLSTVLVWPLSSHSNFTSLLLPTFGGILFWRARWRQTKFCCAVEGNFFWHNLIHQLTNWKNIAWVSDGRGAMAVQSVYYLLIRADISVGRILYGVSRDGTGTVGWGSRIPNLCRFCIRREHSISSTTTLQGPVEKNGPSSGPKWCNSIGIWGRCLHNGRESWCLAVAAGQRKRGVQMELLPLIPRGALCSL